MPLSPAPLTRRGFLAATGIGVLTRVPRVSTARYDLLIQGGRVIDPASRVDHVADVAMQGGRIRAVRPNIATGDAADVLDARGKLVTPGLVDDHVPVGAPELTPAMLLRDGVTSMVDAGSAGVDNIDALVRVAQGAPSRVRILLNLARTGVTGAGELLDLAAADVEAAQAAIARHRDWIVGIKARLSQNVAGEHDLEGPRIGHRKLFTHAVVMNGQRVNALM